MTPTHPTAPTRRPVPDPETGEPPVDTTRRTYEQVRDAILSGVLEPGTWVSQVQLAARLNVSRTPLREALRRLQTEGLVQLDFNRRLRVAPLSVPDLESLYALRIVSEPLAVRISVPQLGKDELDEAADCLDRLRRADHGDQDAVIIPHRRFHFLLFSHCEDRLRLQVEEMWDHAVRYVSLYHRAEDFRLGLITMGRSEHERIFAAAAARDGALAGRLVAEHLARTALTVVAAVAGGHDPRTVREALNFVLTAAPGVSPSER
ncbi:GntR family transcriptional regulator [Streptomyces sp. NBC_00988]|uniref:GntR family transcriptional regulator n=1 Tax=Streptomyces sp. NBC_00988 TaxID=2903704 RepID=UPI00386D884B|nr:GntR family transcriptional regulator [Streptomyces sp. NBC_00988]